MPKTKQQMLMELLLDNEFETKHKDKLKEVTYGHLCHIYRVWNDRKDSHWRGVDLRGVVVDVLMNAKGPYKKKLKKVKKNDKI